MLKGAGMSSHVKLMLLLALMLVVTMIASLHLGLRTYTPAQVLAALGGDDSGTDALVITTLRLPRTLIAVTCGAALGLSGLLMQAATRNPLAEPGLLGVNSGAALAVVIGMTLLGVGSMAGLALAAGIGALLAVAAVFGFASMGDIRFDPTSILLIGVTLAALCGALTQVILLSNETALEVLLFWLSGSFADRDIGLLWIGLPALIAGFAAVLLLARALEALRADDDSAAALGVPVMRVRYCALVIAALLAGAAVAMAGPVIFIGLVAPHIARLLWGDAGYGWLACGTVLVGALIAMIADILARIVLAPAEAPIGALLALVGVPILVTLLRHGAARRRA